MVLFSELDLGLIFKFRGDIVVKKYLVLFTSFLFSAGVLAKDIQYNFRVDGITCPFCVATSQKALSKIEGVISVSANLDKGMIYVCADESVKFTDEQLKELFLEKGFTYRDMTISEKCDDE